MRLGFVLICFALPGCRSAEGPAAPATGGPFEADVAFLRQHTQVVLLTNPSGESRVAVAPGYQGRVMTSTTGGNDAPSFGWLGRDAIASRERQPHINVFGGEDRFWLGPEGGQYSLYFKQGDPFDLDHWQVPDAIDWGAWEVASRSPAAVRFRKQSTLTNYRVRGCKSISIVRFACSVHPKWRRTSDHQLEWECVRSRSNRQIP